MRNGSIRAARFTDGKAEAGKQRALRTQKIVSGDGHFLLPCLQLLLELRRRLGTGDIFQCSNHATERADIVALKRLSEGPEVGVADALVELMEQHRSLVVRQRTVEPRRPLAETGRLFRSLTGRL
jgi:hypothetical protein